MNSFFFEKMKTSTSEGPDKGIQRFLTKAIKQHGNASISDLTHIFIPINQNQSHWFAIVVNIRDRELIIVDSMSKHPKGYSFEEQTVKNALAWDGLLGKDAKNWQLVVCTSNP